ncbi:receptor-type tyrosine-protein phosphatase C isoform X2 [Lampetra fluviatilis]
MEPPFARCIAVCALMCLVVSVSHAAAATTQTQASTTPNASPKASSASTQSSMTTTQTQASTTPSASPKSSSASTQSPMSAVSTATTNNLTTITSTFSPTDSTASTNNQTTGSMLSSPAGSTIAPNDQTSGPTSSSHNGSTPGSTTSGPSTGPTSSVCEQPTDFICQSFTDGANALLLCRWEEKPRNTCHGYKVHCAANTTSLGQPQSFTKTTKHIILFQNVRNDINYICTLNSSNRPNLTILVTRNIPGFISDSHQPHPGLSSGQIVTIVLLLVIVVVCLIFLRKFYLKIRKLERQYNNDEGVCLLPKGIRGFQKETIVKESAPIPAKVLRQTVQTKTASGSKLFQEEFSNFPRKINKYSQQEATQEYNTKKNRYSDILPYDHNRVKLSGEGESDYINASYVDGYKSSIRYIAAQGPLENTAGDFWQMIWEKKSSVIVMVTKCEEMGKVKCFQYWPHPDEDKRAYGDVTVTIVDEKPYADIVIRTLSISHSKHKGFGAHWVTHVQLVSWPDHGVPEDPNLLLKLRRRVNSFNGAGCTAVVVHCSAGVGRSGTYIGLDCLVRQLENEGHVDVYGCVFRLRHQRPLMVQVEQSQYVLLHRALLEHHLFGNTELSMAKLHSRVQAMKFKASQQDQSPVDVEFKRLPTFEGTFAQKAGRNSNNVSKNRSTNVIPYDFNRVKLWKFTPSEINDEEDDDDNNSDEDESDNENSDKDYINASFMDGYHKQKSIIATQNPLPDTVSDFWLMVVQQNCSHIVMLSELSEGGKEQSAHYWPLKGTQNYGAVGVTVRNVTSRRDLVVREFSLTYENKESVVTQIQYPHWKPDGLPKSPKALVAIMNAVQGCQKENGNNRHIVVHCSDGASRTGIFCALWNTLEAARVEGMVDFFQAVKWLNMQRPAIVQEKVHYRFLYETVCSFVNSTNGIQNAYKVALENVGSMHSVDIISEL